MKLLSSNLWLLPFAASADNRLRMQRFLLMVKELDPDIICLQEVWMMRDVKRIVCSLGMHAVWSGRGIANLGGLLTLSKTPIQNVERHTFPTPWCSPIGIVAQKGMLSCSIAGHKIVNVHLHDPGSAAQQYITLHQFETLKAFTGDGFVAGDLNIRYGVLKDLNNNFFKLPTHEQHTRSKSNKYQHMRKNRLEFNEDQVDYVLGTKKRISIRVITEPLVSDHYPVLAQLFNKRRT